MIRDPTSLYQGDISPRTEKAARIVSAVGSPFSMSLVLFVALGLRIEDPFLRLGSIAVCIVLAVALPLAVVRHYSRKFDNKDGDIYRREDRRNPIMIGVACYLLCLAALYAMIGMDLLTAMLVCYMASTLLVGLVSLRWKISIHATGVVGPAIGLAMAYPPYGGLLILALPLVAWSRYVMRKHTPLQLAAGAALGAVVTLTLLYILLRRASSQRFPLRDAMYTPAPNTAPRIAVIPLLKYLEMYPLSSRTVPKRLSRRFPTTPAAKGISSRGSKAPVMTSHPIAAIPREATVEIAVPVAEIPPFVPGGTLLKVVIR